MGQNSSVAVGASKLAPDSGRLIVDASDSCVSGVKLRSTGIIPISELIKQEKCSKNIQKLEQTYYNNNSSSNKKNIEIVKQKEDPKSKKNKADFIETSYEDVPERRQWVRANTLPKKQLEPDAVKIGLKKPSKTKLNDKGKIKDKKREHLSKEPTTKVHYQNSIPEGNRNIKEVNIREKTKTTKQEHAVDGRKEIRPSIRKEGQKNIGIGTQEYIKPKIKTAEKKTISEQSKKTILKNNVIGQKFKDSSIQTITKDKATSYENIKQLYKRNDYDNEKKITKNKCQEEGKKSKQPYNEAHQSKQHKNKKEKVYRVKDVVEESSHQFQKHEMSLPKRKSRKYTNNLKMETIVSCSIHPEKYFQYETISNENQLDRRTGRNYINRKMAGEYHNKNDKYIPYSKDIDSLNSCELLPPSLSLLPSASTLERAIKEHRKYVSAKEALESWKNLHTWKQHRKRFELARNGYHQDNFDVATQTISHCSENIVRSSKSNQFIQTSSAHEDIVVPSEKHLYKDFIVKMEHCLQKHSRLCEINAKRHGDGRFTWVQDKYRRWHKIMFDDCKN